MFQNGIKFLPMKRADSARKCSSKFGGQFRITSAVLRRFKQLFAFLNEKFIA